jgi:hypothetical protein
LTVALMRAYLKARNIEKLLPKIPNKTHKPNLLAFLTAIADLHRTYGN